MTANNKDFTVHPYDTDAIEFPERPEYIDQVSGKTIEDYLQFKEDMALMDKHPALREAWERYEVLVKLYRENNSA